jgi:hypothetical protein
MDDAVSINKSSINGDVGSSSPVHDLQGDPLRDPTRAPTTLPTLNQDPVQQTPSVEGSLDQTPPVQATPRPAPVGQAPVGQKPESEMSDREWFQQLPDADPLVEKLDRNMAPIEQIYEQMAEILHAHLAQHQQISDLQDVSRECDLVLQYGKQIGRLLKFEQDLRVNRDKIDPVEYLRSRPRREKKPK